MPALARAQKLGHRAAESGFDWDDIHGVMDKLEEELAELALARAGQGQVEEEIGDLLFTVVNLSRHEGIDAEGALRKASAKFERRFRALESRVVDGGRALQDMDAEALDDIWQSVKENDDRA